MGAAVAMLVAALVWWAGEPPPPPGLDDSAGNRFPRQPPPENTTRAGPDAGALPAAEISAPEACNSVPPAARMSCPLRGRTVRMANIPSGVRLWVRESGLPGVKLEATLQCQLALVAVRPELPLPCPFLNPPPELVVRQEDNNHVTVDLLWPRADQGALGLYRERVATGLSLAPNKRK
jgi:hypothetical protein